MRGTFKSRKNTGATFGARVPTNSKLSDFQFIISNSRMALGVNVVQLNLYLKRLIDRVSKTHILVEIDALFRASEEVEPSHIGTLFDFFITNTFLHHEYFLHHGYVLVPGVGLVFEFYYYLAATRKDRK